MLYEKNAYKRTYFEWVILKLAATEYYLRDTMCTGFCATEPRMGNDLCDARAKVAQFSSD